MREQSGVSVLPMRQEDHATGRLQVVVRQFLFALVSVKVAPTHAVDIVTVMVAAAFSSRRVNRTQRLEVGRVNVNDLQLATEGHAKINTFHIAEVYWLLEIFIQRVNYMEQLQRNIASFCPRSIVRYRYRVPVWIQR